MSKFNGAGTVLLSELLRLAQRGEKFGSILVDPPWRFTNRTGKMAPEHKRLMRYRTMTFEEITGLPVPDLAAARSHLYLWVPNALVLDGLEVMKRWGFKYKTNLVWFKVRKDAGPDRRGVGFYVPKVKANAAPIWAGVLSDFEPN